MVDRTEKAASSSGQLVAFTVQFVVSDELTQNGDFNMKTICGGAACCVRP